MTSIVLDASLALSRILPDEDSNLIDRILADRGEERVELLVTPHWRLECWNGILVAQRRGRISPEDAHAARREVVVFPVLRLPNHAPDELIFELAERHALSIYDAAHLALALQENALLATGDERLAAAAEKVDALWK